MRGAEVRSGLSNSWIAHLVSEYRATRPAVDTELGRAFLAIARAARRGERNAAGLTAPAPRSTWRSGSWHGLPSWPEPQMAARRGRLPRGDYCPGEQHRDPPPAAPISDGFDCGNHANTQDVAFHRARLTGVQLVYPSTAVARETPGPGCRTIRPRNGHLALLAASTESCANSPYQLVSANRR